MHRLRHKAKTQVGRLLRVLFLRLGAVSTNSGPARRRVGRSVVLCLVGNEQPDSGHLARLARQQTHPRVRVGGSACRNHWRSVRSGIAANRRLGHRSRLDGCGVHAARRCNRTHCRYTGPYYLAMIVPVMALGTGPVTVGVLGWLSLAVLIVGGSALIWWATERAWGKFSQW